MQANESPGKIWIPFAYTGQKNDIPIFSQVGVTPGKASYTTGFPPLTMTPLTAGGIPPFGQDFNGILYAITAVQQWACGGGMWKYDSGWSAANAGYATGAVLLKADNSGFWMCTADNNASNPDAGGANWKSLPSGIATAAQAQAMTDNNVAVSPSGLSSAFKGPNQLLTSSGYQKLPGGLILQWGTLDASSSGAYTAWPIAFPNVCLRAVATHASVGTPVAVSCGIATVNGGNFYLAAAVNGTISYFAMGY